MTVRDKFQNLRNYIDSAELELSVSSGKSLFKRIFLLGIARRGSGMSFTCFLENVSLGNCIFKLEACYTYSSQNENKELNSVSKIDFDYHLS